MFVPKTTAAVFFVLLVVNIGVCLFLQQQELSLNIQAQRGLLSNEVVVASNKICHLCGVPFIFTLCYTFSLCDVRVNGMVARVDL